MIAPTVFPVGVSTNWFKKFINYRSYFPQFYCKSYQILWRCRAYVALLVYQILLKLVHNNIVSIRFYCLVCRRRREIRRKSDEFQGLVSQELLGLFLSNVVCKVLYMKTLKYVDLVGIGAIVFEL